jgi:nucleoside-diphosphate-sugar epimerase
MMSTTVQRRGKLEGLKILVTGATGAVARPIVRALAPGNDVHALARLRTPADAQKLEGSGATPVPFDLATGSFDDLNEDYDLVLNFAVRRSADDDFEQEMVTGAEALGLLMQRCRGARAFFHCSSTAVYRPPGDHPAREADPLGDHHGSQLPTYSIGKIVAEGVARSASRAYGLPTVIARLGVPYGPVWGWPTRHLEDIAAGRPLLVHPTDPMLFSPIHERDIIDQLAALVDAAAVPATVVNWGGDDAVGMQEWCALMGELIGAEPIFRTSERAFRGAPADAAARTAITGPTRVPWREGMTAMVADWQARRADESATPA